MTVERDMRDWLERAVIGLNLCPFAKAVHVKGLIHYDVCLATEPVTLLDALRQALEELTALPPDERETTLLIAPHCLGEFLDFNDFLGRADALLARMGLGSDFQIASFHPRYQFAGTEADDVTNCTNRAPYPTLHLLREASVDRAVDAFPEAEAIFETNMETLQRLGPDGWAALNVGPKS